MTKTLVIVRHGNTFLPEQTPTRVGVKTDLPLVETEKAIAVAEWLEKEKIIPDKIYAAPLKRTMETLSNISKKLKLNLPIVPLSDFSEIDYGPDENKTEDEVINRLGKLYACLPNQQSCSENQIREAGKAILEKWDSDAIVPDGWIVNIEQIINNWKKLADSIPDNSINLLCTSNGIIRFAPYLLEESYADFCKKNSIKVATGSISIFQEINGKWVCKYWNLKPLKLLNK